ncbi:MAG: phosphatase PAP2 family protein [Endomicrobium sp.]|nr:phosphatase PAP2 family protein [Endomicrobium sp.]
MQATTYILSTTLFIVFIISVLLCVKASYSQKSKAILLIKCFSVFAIIFLSILTIFNEPTFYPHRSAISYSILSIYIIISHLILKFWHSTKWFRVCSYVICGGYLLIIITTLLCIAQTEKLISQGQNEEIKHIHIDNKGNYENKILMPYMNSNRDNKKAKNFILASCKPSNITSVHQKLMKINYKAFKYINSDIKCKYLDFYISLISYCDSKKINLSVILILIISIGILWDNKKDYLWPILALLASSLAVGTILTYTLKYYFKSPRPLIILGDKNVNIMFETLHSFSFPSGHAQVAFSTCTFMFMVVKKYWYWYIILSLGVAFERIYTGSHFPSDVLCGAVIGILTTLIIINLSKNNSKHPFLKYLNSINK